MEKYEGTKPEGALTALITPFVIGDIDWKGYNTNIEFQISEGISGLVPVGTTGESPTTSHEEHISLIRECSRAVNKRCPVIGSTGSNSTAESMDMTKAVEKYIDGVLLVDCYYNGPSSLELRREYYEPIAAKFPHLLIVPYVIPGRTGTAIIPQDLMILNSKYPNVAAIKEATGELERMIVERKLMPYVSIISGDDNLTAWYRKGGVVKEGIMVHPDVRGEGVISVVSNVAPRYVEKLTRSILDGNYDEARKLWEDLEPLFNVVTVSTTEEIEYNGDVHRVSYKFRNPVPIKTLMKGLGMCAGSVRQPLGRMTESGVEQVRNAAIAVYNRNPEVLKPIEDAYNVSLQERLFDDRFWKPLAYERLA
ncbi:MAG: 4-hydroxy-tetrahydrodipicolinate synthase [Candidatus Aenigmarchaeota archaeon]|nr:4-hydroxy-tetrahydrodipicolinate synthase [Candidatus Aenigmarchaeota archaeon]